MKSIKKIFMILILIVLCTSVPSISLATAKKTANITYASGKYAGPNGTATGEIDDPVILSGAYDEIVVAFGSNSEDSKFEYPFYFKFTGNGGNNYLKYLVTVSDTEKRVVFKKIAEAGDIKTFNVTSYDKKQGPNYLQPGAVFNDNYEKMGFSPPLYKIEAFTIFKSSWGKSKLFKTNLGNSILGINNSVEASMASHPQVYVFCASGLSESNSLRFSSGQIGKASVVLEYVKKKDGKYDIHNTTNTTKVTAATESAYRIGGNRYGFGGNKVDVIYAFWGVTSEILDDNEVGDIEKIIAKILISIGDTFRIVLAKMCGKDLTIDSLIFNEYQKTVVDFWGGNGTYVDVFRTIINGWFDAFRTFAVVVLGMVLVFVGIQSILYSGTPNEKKIQGMVVGWIIAVGLMFLGPYFMKYAITMNDALVATLKGQKKYSVTSVYNTDFVEKWGEEMQLGEDSKTKSLLDTLIAYHAEIEAEYGDAKAELESVQGNLDTRMENIENLNKTTQYDFFDETGIRRSVLQTREMIDYKVRTSGMTPAEAEEYARSLISEVKVRTTNDTSAFWTTVADTTTKYEMQNLMGDYAAAYARSEELKLKLEESQKAIDMANKGIDLESVMRERAGETYRLVYVLVWYIMIYQLVLLLFIYYKRLVIVGALIIIYPLVIMMYAIEKAMGIGNPKTLKTWITEYVVNIFVQSVHALIYIMLVEAGLKVFEDDHDNWLLFLFAVLSIFPAESIIKSILGMKASSVGNLKNASANALGIVGATWAARKLMVSGDTIDKRNKAHEKEIAEKFAKKDKNTKFAREFGDNLKMKNALKTGDASKIEEARKKIEESNKRREQQDKERDKKRAAAKKRRDTRAASRKKWQVAKNAAALGDALTTAAALGFDPNDFQVGFAAAGLISGSNKAKPKVDKDEDKKKSGSRYSGDKTNTRNKTSNKQGAGGTPNTSNRSAEEARKATSESGGSSSGGRGSSTPAWSDDLRSKYREALGGHYSNGGSGGGRKPPVNTSTPQYDVTENNND